ncbi:MAG TPA: SDR family oxidoreductase [Cytophagaceae bacterium]|nr:SDR family oxidoreductase [Cytophagaceae bacterium]
MKTKENMENKIVVVTGANSGMGKVTALELAKKGFTVVLVCRNKQLGEEAKQDIIAQSGNTRIDLLLADLSSQKSIRQMVLDFKSKYNHLDVLVNNAGLAFSKFNTSVDGIEMTFAVNHLGYFLPTVLLLDSLKAAPSARIVNVSSSTHKGAKINFEDIEHKKNYSLFGSYNQSKLCNVLFTKELARKLKGTNVSVNCLNPGPVKTGLARDMGPVFQWLAKSFFPSAEKASATAIYLASSPEVEKITGRYFEKCKVVPSSKISNDEKIAKKLWDLSTKMTGLN